MNKISINLLPAELGVAEKKQFRKIWIIRITVVVIGVISALAAVALGLVIFKNNEQSQVNLRLKQAEQQVASLNEQEGYLTLLRQRLDSVITLQQKENKQTQGLSSITQIVPEEVAINSLAVDRNGTILLSGLSNGVIGLNSLVNALGDSTKNNFTKTNIDSLSKGTTDSYRFDISTKLK
ncbi:hypothetical protein HY025_05680 [Candidatus Daviesbacteria bacterium]|nr:hypothetical protein [Candidatus Daviesbacteria bacterium]